MRICEPNKAKHLECGYNAWCKKDPDPIHIQLSDSEFDAVMSLWLTIAEARALAEQLLTAAKEAEKGGGK